MGIAANLFEQRSTLANPSRWLERWLLGGSLPDTYTGRDVNHETALTYSGWAAGVLLISEVMGSLPLHLRRGIDANGREASEIARDHPLDSVLSLRPNPETTAMEFRAIIESHLLSDGNFYAQKLFDGAGRVRELWPLEPTRMEVERGDRQQPLRYLYTRADGSPVAFTNDDLFHLRMLSRDGVKGISPLELARQAVGIGLAVEEYAGRFFSNSASVRGVLQTDGALSDNSFQRLKEDWDRIYRGQQNAHKVAILEEGLKFQTIGISPKDSQMLDLRKFQVTEIARIIRVPPHLLQDLDRATFNNIEELGIGFVKYSLVHRCVRLEQAISTQLLTEDERQVYFPKHNLKGLLRGDTQRQSEFYKIGLEGGWLSPNDIRELEDLNPIEGGDLYTQQLQRAPLSVIAQAGPAGQAAPAPQPDAPDANADDSARSVEVRALKAQDRIDIRKVFAPLIQDAAERLVKFDAGVIVQEGLRVLQNKGLAEFEQWLDGHYNRLIEEATKRLRAAMQTYGVTVAGIAAKEVGGTTNEESVRVMIDGLIQAFAVRYAASSVAQIRAIIRNTPDNETDTIALIEERLKEWKDSRPEKISRGETVGLGEAVAKAAMIAAGVSAFRWVTSGENCPLCDSMNGKVIRGTQAFLGQNETLEVEGRAPLRPSSPVFSPPLHHGCDCYLIPGA